MTLHMIVLTTIILAHKNIATKATEILPQLAWPQNDYHYDYPGHRIIIDVIILVTENITPIILPSKNIRHDYPYHRMTLDVIILAFESIAMIIVASKSITTITLAMENIATIILVPEWPIKWLSWPLNDPCHDYQGPWKHDYDGLQKHCHDYHCLWKYCHDYLYRRVIFAMIILASKSSLPQLSWPPKTLP